MRNSFLPLLMELVLGSKGVIDRTRPRLESGETLVDGEKTFRAEQPGTFRFLDRVVEVSVAPSESIAEVIEPARFLREEGPHLPKRSLDMIGHPLCFEATLWTYES